MKSAVKIGHIVRLNFIIGFPHETLWDCLKTLIFGLRSALMYGVSDINFAIFVPYPGSELFETLKAENKIIVNDGYFKRLLVQFDLTRSYSYCDNVSTTTLMILRFLGFSISYLTIYLSRPKKIFNLFKNILNKKFIAQSLIEQRVYDMFIRHKLKSK